MQRFFTSKCRGKSLKDRRELETSIESALVAAHRSQNKFIIYLLEMALAAAKEEVQIDISKRRAPS